MAHVEGVKCLEGSLKEALISIKSLEKDASSLKDEIVVAFDQYFELAKERVTSFYTDLDLNRMDMFKVVWDSQLVDDE